MVLQVCGSGVELACAPARSIWPTLASAASTLALLVAANWNLSWVISEGPKYKYVNHILFVFTTPLLPLVICLSNALQVWRVKESIKRKEKEKLRTSDPSEENSVHASCIPILVICPLVIEIPADAKTEDELRKARGYKIIDNIEKLSEPLTLEPKTKDDNEQQLQDSASTDQKTYLQHKVSLFDYDLEIKLKERELLLQLGLAPEYSQLRYVRSRDTFQVVVTVIQASGYVFSVVQRLAQHLASCPLEAFLCLLSAITISQLLLEIYACSHYQRSLVLRLNGHQFSEFWKNPSREAPRSKRTPLIMLFTIYLVLSILLSYLSISYAIHYMHSCHVCFIAALLLTLSLLSWFFFVPAALLFDFISCKSLPDISPLIGVILPVLFSAALFIVSMVVALVSTATHWDLFHSPTHNSFSWILPHVSNQA